MKNLAPTKFSDINTVENMKLYLDDSDRRLRNSPFLYHYTTFSNVVKMIQGRTWHLCNAAAMNDKLEYKNGYSEYWDHLFFSCFMGEVKESIGMWSMYAQPWEQGVKIALPRKTVQNWIENTKELLEIGTDYMPTGRKFDVDKDEVSLKISSVAYSNTDSRQDKNDREKIVWSTATNYNFKKAVHISKLTGYIKDIAWSYEKEIRIKTVFKSDYSIFRVAIPLTDELINNMIVTASPLFEKDLKSELKRNTGKDIQSEKSIFTDRLNIITICQRCEYKLK